MFKCKTAIPSAQGWPRIKRPVLARVYVVPHNCPHRVPHGLQRDLDERFHQTVKATCASKQAKGCGLSPPYSKWKLNYLVCGSKLPGSFTNLSSTPPKEWLLHVLNVGTEKVPRSYGSVEVSLPSS